MTSRNLLIEALGDLSDYRFTGWIYDCREGWDKQWKCMDEPLPQTETPEATRRCHCGITIRYHYLIQHKHTHVHHFVGSVCYANFASLHKSCPDCYVPHKAKKSIHCQDCRIKCKLCDTYHSSNIIHKPMSLKFGKHRGASIADLIQSDPKYLLYLGEQEWVDDSTIERIQLLINKVILPFGKYSQKSIQQIRTDDPSYLEYIFRQSRLH